MWRSHNKRFLRAELTKQQVGHKEVHGAELLLARPKFKVKTWKDVTETYLILYAQRVKDDGVSLFFLSNASVIIKIMHSLHMIFIYLV